MVGVEHLKQHKTSIAVDVNSYDLAENLSAEYRRAFPKVVPSYVRQVSMLDGIRYHT